jgi:Glycosyl transferases group 1
MVDVLMVSLGATGGLRVADDELYLSLRRVGASVAVARPFRPDEVPTMMLTDLVWAHATRAATKDMLVQLRRSPARSVIYSSTTAALLWPRVGAIRFDAPAAGNRPGRHGLWQRPLERRRLRQAPLLLPWSAGGLREAPSRARAEDRALVLPIPVEPSGSPEPARDIAAITYAANPSKKGLDRVLSAWRAARHDSEELVVAGVSQEQLTETGIAMSEAEGVRVVGSIAHRDYRALLRRARVFVSAPRREDYGIAQLEALADGCQLVTTPAPGPYVALALARELDPRLVGDDLATALRAALDDPLSDYAPRALAMLAPFRRDVLDKLVADEMLPRLLAAAAQ